MDEPRAESVLAHVSAGHGSSSRLGAVVEAATGSPRGPSTVGGVLADRRMAALYDRHAEPLLRFLLRLTLGNRAAAEDMLQETIVRAWQNLDKLPEDVAALRPWLFTVARRVAIDAGRAKMSRPVEVTMTDRVREPVGPDLAERVTAVHTIREAIEKLSPDHRLVLHELYFRGSTTTEAARRLGIPEGTVKSRAHYAMRSLAAIIGPADGK